MESRFLFETTETILSPSAGRCVNICISFPFWALEWDKFGQRIFLYAPLRAKRSIDNRITRKLINYYAWSARERRAQPRSPKEAASRDNDYSKLDIAHPDGDKCYFEVIYYHMPN